MQASDPGGEDQPIKQFDYATPPQRVHGAWIRLPKDHYRLRILLPAYVCCQCMSEGNARSYRDDLPVALCPVCRLAWRRRERIVTIASVLAVVVTIVIGMALVVMHQASGQWSDLVTATAGITGGAIFLVFPLFYFFASPVIVFRGKNDEMMWVRLPNERYVRLIQFKAS